METTLSPRPAQGSASPATVKTSQGQCLTTRWTLSRPWPALCPSLLGRRDPPTHTQAFPEVVCKDLHCHEAGGKEGAGHLRWEDPAPTAKLMASSRAMRSPSHHSQPSPPSSQLPLCSPCPVWRRKHQEHHTVQWGQRGSWEHGLRLECRQKSQSRNSLTNTKHPKNAQKKASYTSNSAALASRNNHTSSPGPGQSVPLHSGLLPLQGTTHCWAPSQRTGSASLPPSGVTSPCPDNRA